jgi:hypothetical protein
MLSLQEESPEIPSKAKIQSHNPPLFNKKKSFSLSKTKPGNQSLLLSCEIVNTNNVAYPPINDEPRIEKEPKNDMKTLILETFKNDDELSLGQKIAFTYFLNMNKNSFNDELIREFIGEECHLSLLNWVWRYKKKLKQFQLQNQLKNNFFDNFEIFLPQYNKLLIEINIIMELLINILNFFIFLPINSSDILHLKLYEKLIKIKGFINSYANDYLLNLINFVLNKWKAIVDAENEEKIITRFKLSQLGVKHPRSQDEKEDKEDTEADSVDYNEENNKININNNSIIYNLNKKIKNKNNIKVSFDLQKNSIIYFKKDDIPFKISLDKQIKDKSN